MKIREWLPNILSNRAKQSDHTTHTHTTFSKLSFPPVDTNIPPLPPSVMFRDQHNPAFHPRAETNAMASKVQMVAPVFGTGAHTPMRPKLCPPFDTLSTEEFWLFCRLRSQCLMSKSKPSQTELEVLPSVLEKSPTETLNQLQNLINKPSILASMEEGAPNTPSQEIFAKAKLLIPRILLNREALAVHATSTQTTVPQLRFPPSQGPLVQPNQYAPSHIQMPRVQGATSGEAQSRRIEAVRLADVNKTLNVLTAVDFPDNNIKRRDSKFLTYMHLNCGGLIEEFRNGLIKIADEYAPEGKE